MDQDQFETLCKYLKDLVNASFNIGVGDTDSGPYGLEGVSMSLAGESISTPVGPAISELAGSISNDLVAAVDRHTEAVESIASALGDIADAIRENKEKK